MKIIKPRYDLLLYFYLPFSFLCSLIYWFFPDLLALLGYTHWLLLGSLLIFCFSKSSKIHLGHTPSRSFTAWLWLLFLSQGVINLLFWSFFRVLTFDLDTYTYQGQFSFLYFVFNVGFFPVGFYILCALTLGYFTYTKNKLGLLSSAFEPLFSNSHLDSIGIAVDTYMRSVTITAVVFIVTVTSLVGIILIHYFFAFPIMHGLKFGLVIIGTTFLILTRDKHWFSFLNYITHSRLSTTFLLLGFIVGLIIVYSILELLIKGLSVVNPILDLTILPYNNSITNKAIVLELWWLAFGIITGAFIAFISKGRTLRQVFAYSLITSLVGWGLIFILDTVFLKGKLPTLTPFYICALTCLVILVVTTHKKYISNYLRATLPTDKSFKTRSTYLFLKTVPVTSSSLLCLYFATGTSVWGYITTLVLLPPIILVLLSFVAFYCATWQKSKTT